MKWLRTDPRTYTADCNRDYMTIIALTAEATHPVAGSVFAGCDGSWSVHLDPDQGRSKIDADEDWPDWQWIPWPEN